MIPSQADMLFPAHAVSPPGPLPASASPVSVDTPDGERLEGVHIPPRGGRKSRTLILGFGGNAWNGSDVAAFLHQIYPDEHVVVFHYRGYRPSTGRASAEALLADAPVVRDFAVGLVKPQVTVAAGFSIGSGMASLLARDSLVNGAILVTPFDSLKAVAADLYPWLPIGLFFQHEIDSAAFLSRSRVPVAIIAGEHDTLIQPPRTEGLRKRAANLVFDRTIPRAGHNDIYERPEFASAMHEALKQVSANPDKGQGRGD
jgi:pimeloyl-ACP methyl ester carboxylesterase